MLTDKQIEQSRELVATGREVLRRWAQARADRDRYRDEATQWHDTYQNEVNARDEFFGELLKLLPGAEDTGMDAYDQIPRGIERIIDDRARLTKGIQQALHHLNQGYTVQPRTILAGLLREAGEKTC